MIYISITLECSVISIRPTRGTMLLGRWGEWLNSAIYNLRKATAVQADSISSKLKANHSRLVLGKIGVERPEEVVTMMLVSLGKVK